METLTKELGSDKEMKKANAKPEKTRCSQMQN